MSRRPPLESATVDAVARELIAAWPVWEADAGQCAQEYDEPAEGERRMMNLVSDYLARAVCRVRGHEGPVWHNPNGLEPDMRCKGCGENLG